MVEIFFLIMGVEEVWQKGHEKPVVGWAPPTGPAGLGAAPGRVAVPQLAQNSASGAIDEPQLEQKVSADVF